MKKLVGATLILEKPVVPTAIKNHGISFEVDYYETFVMELENFIKITRPQTPIRITVQKEYINVD